MLRNFLYRRSDTWVPHLRQFFERHGITVANVSDGSAEIHYNGVEGLLKAVKSLTLLSIGEFMLTLGIGIAIGIWIAR
jgi:hypothetical protein